MSSSQYSSTPTTSTSSPSFFPRPVFASDLVAQKVKKFPSASSSSSSSTPGTNSNTNKPQRNSQQYFFGTNSSTANTSGPGHSMMDLSSKLGELPTIQLPDFHLPDLHRLKQQLHKHTPSFSLKSLQHTFNVPSYTSFTSTTPSTSSSNSATPTPGSRNRLSSLSSRRSSTRSNKDALQDSSLNASSSTLSSSSASTSAFTSVGRVSENKSQLPPDPPTSAPIAIPPVSLPHPSNYLIKKANPSQTSLTLSSTTSHSNVAPTSSSPIVLSTATEISTPSAPTSSAPASSSKSPVGHLFLQIIEARNLTLVNPQSVSRPYCLVEYDQNELITPPALAEIDIMGRRGTDVFARAMAASSPKWRHDAEFDVVRPNQQISITIYDSCGDDVDPTEPAKRFLGQVRLKPSEIHNRMIDSWFRLQGREAGGEQVTGEIRVTIKYQAIESRHLSTADFDILRVLGIGSFGKVYQVRKKDTGRIYAMKVLNKKQIIEQKQVEHTIAERNVLVQALQSPFIVGLKFSFQTPTKLYLVQDFMNGGELFFHMQNEGTFSEARARFYTAELVLALEHLHSCNVVYRDLKPENILLSSQGHIVLVDFGLCKQNVTEDERTHTFCGTTEYLAPEIVKGTGYGKAVDWWSLGVLLYEMLVGASPFVDTRTEGTYHKILHQPVIFPSPGHPHHHYHHTILKETTHNRQSTDVDLGSKNGIGISHNAQGLIQRFLDKNPKTRLGSGKGVEAVAAIKAHPFFKGIDFERLQTRDVTPPFQPHVGVMGDLDVSNFDAHFTDQTATLGMNSKKKGQASYLSASGSSPSSRSSSTLMDGQAGAFLLQQQQKAANLYRQQQKQGDNSRLNPNVARGRRSSNSWSSYRTPSTDSLFTLSEPSSPAQTRAGAGPSSTRWLPPHKARALQEEKQQLQQQRQQEYFQGFTFEGESILETLKRQDDELQRSIGGNSGATSLSAMVANENKKPAQLFSGEATSVDSIFGSM
ncbi:hypothetical protein BGZ93_006112 [Podila epicladia]|nr:hypothetical protein BGZ92_008492 [Podila epicladia]KAG0099744.1 hypothetical protein BGZ93_006112 [Podila epicladia]